jgi:hypothetical protein
MRFVRAFIAPAAAALIALSATAQSNDETRTTFSDDAGGWRVISYERDGAFAGCRAILKHESGRLQFSLEADRWTMSVPNRKFDDGSGAGSIVIDGVKSTTEFLFIKNWARLELTEADLAALRNAAMLRVNVKQLKARDWPLAGLAAALDTTQDCLRSFDD